MIMVLNKLGFTLKEHILCGVSTIFGNTFVSVNLFTNSSPYSTLDATPLPNKQTDTNFASTSSAVTYVGNEWRDLVDSSCVDFCTLELSLGLFRTLSACADEGESIFTQNTVR